MTDPKEPKFVDIPQFNPTKNANIGGSGEMPLIDLNKVQTSNLQTPGILSADISGLNKSFIGQPMMPGRDPYEYQAINQSGWDQAGNAVGRLVGGVALKTLQGVGYLAGLAGVGNKEELGKSWILGAANNSMAQAMVELEESLKDLLPIYKTSAYRNADIFSGLLTKPEFWADDVIDGLAFMGSSLLTGYGAGMAGAALGTTAKATQAMRNLGMSAGNAAKVSNAMGLASRAALMSAMEAMQEADGVKKIVENNLLSEIDPSTGTLFTAEKAKAIAAKRASDTFALNMVALAPSNVFEASLFFKKLPSGFGANRITREGSKFVQKEYGNVLSKYANTVVGRGVTKGIEGALAEGLYEENIQHSIQEINSRAYDPISDNQDTVERLFRKAGEGIIQMADLGDPDRARAVALGMIIGAPSATISGVKEKVEQNKRTAEGIKNLNESQKNIMDFYKRSPRREVMFEQGENGSYVRKEIAIDKDGKPVEGVSELNTPITPEDYEKQSAELGISAKDGQTKVLEEAVETDAQGNPVVSQTKLNEYIQNLSLNASINDLLLLYETQKGNTKISTELAKGFLMASHALKFFRAGEAELLYESLDKYKDTTPEELAVFGVKPNGKNINADIEEAKRKFKALEDYYNRIELSTYKGKGESHAEFAGRKQFLLGQAAQIESLKHFLGEAQKNVNKFEEGLINNPEASKLVNLSALLAKKEALEKSLGAILSNKQGRGSEAKKIFHTLRKTDKLITEEIMSIKQGESEKATSEEVELPGDLKEAAEALLKTEEKRLNLGRNSPMSFEYRKNLFRREEIALALETVEDSFDNISHSLEGHNEFKKYNSTERRDSIKALMDITSKTTLKEYLEYERTVSPWKRIMKKNARFDIQKHSAMVLEALERGEDPIEVVKDVLSSNLKLTSNAFNVLKKAVTTNLQTVESDYQKAFENSSEEVIRTYEGLLDSISMGQSMEEAVKNEASYREESDIKEAVDLYTRLQEIPSKQQGLFDALTLLEKFRDILVSKVSKDSDNQIKRDIADEFIDIADSVANQASKIAGYANVEKIESAIDTLKGLKNIFNSRKELLDSPEFEGFIRHINKSLKTLETLREKAIENREKEAVTEKNSERQHSLKIASSLGIDLDNSDGIYRDNGSGILNVVKDLLGEELFNKIQKEGADAGFDSFNMDILEGAVRNVFRNNPASREAFKTKLLEVYNSKMESIPWADFRVIFNKNASHNKPEADHVKETYTANPDKGLSTFLGWAGETMISKDSDTGEVTFGSDSRPGSAIYQYSKEQNVVSLINNLEKEPADRRSPDRKEAINLLLKNHLEVAGLHALINTLNSTYDITDHTNAEHQADVVNSKNTPSDFTPSIEQDNGIKQFAKVFNTPIDVNSNPYSVVSYMEGSAGTGKSKVFIKWAAKILNIKESNILTAGPRKSAAKTIQESVTPNDTTNRHTAEELITLLEEAKDSNLKLVRLLIVDEVGGLTTIQVERIVKAIKKINDTRLENKEKPIKIIFMGDPNQLVDAANRAGANSKGVSPIKDTRKIKDLAYITELPPLTKRHRSNVSAVLDFQDLFIDQPNDLTKESPIVVRSNAENPLLERELLGVNGSSTEDFLPNIVNILTTRDPGDQRRRLIIVDSDQVETVKNVAGIKEHVESGFVEVMDVWESQGETASEVYVNISKGESNSANYNTEVYTAVSRATDYIYIAGFPINHKENLNIISDIEARVASKESAFNYSETVKNRVNRLRALNMLDSSEVDEAEEVVPEPESIENTSLPENEETEIKEEEDNQGTIVDDLQDDSKDQEEEEEENEEEQPQPPQTGTELRGEPSSGVHQVVYTTNTFAANKDIIEDEDSQEHLNVEEDDLVYYIRTSTDLPSNAVDPRLEVGGTTIPVVKILAPKEYLGETIWREVGQIDLRNAKDVEKSTGSFSKELDTMIQRINLSKSGLPKGAYDLEAVTSIPGGKAYRLKRGLQTVSPETVENEYGMSTVNNVPFEERKVLWSGKVSESKKMTIRYDYSKPGKSYKSDTNLKRDIVVNQVFKDLIQSSPWYTLDKDEENALIEELVSKSHIKIYTYEEAKDKNAKNKNFKVKSGIPYVVVPGGIHNQLSELHIQLSPRRMNTGDTFYKNLKLFRNHIQSLESSFNKEGLDGYTYGTEKFNRLVYAMGFDSVAVAGLYDLSKRKKIYTEEEVKESTDPETFKELKGVKFTKAEYELAREIGNMLFNRDGMLEYYKKVNELKALKESFEKASEEGKKSMQPKIEELEKVTKYKPDSRGPLTQAFRDIALSNLFIDDKIVRIQKRLKGKGSKVSFMDTRAVSLLPQVIKPTDPKTSKSGVDAINREIQRLIRVRKISEEEATAQIKELEQEAIDKIKKYNPGFFTIGDLDNFLKVDSEGNSITNQGAGTRINVPIEPGDEGFSHYVENSLAEVSPTRFRISLEYTEEVKNTQSPNIVTKPEEVEDLNFDFDTFLKDLSKSDIQGTTLISTQEALTEIKRLIPSITEEQIQFVDRTAMLRLTEGKSAWGAYKKGVIYLLKNPDNTVYLKVARHETVHYALHSVLDAKERADILDIARQEFNLQEPASSREVEEKIADAFMSWVQGKKSFSDRMIAFFNKILAYFGFIKDHQDTLDSFFDKLEKGQLTGNTVDNSGLVYTKLNIEKDFGGNTQLYSDTRNLVLSVINKYYTGIEHNKDFSPDLRVSSAQNPILRDVPIVTSSSGKVANLPMRFEEIIPGAFNLFKKQLTIIPERLKSLDPVQDKELIDNLKRQEKILKNLVRKRVYANLIEDSFDQTTVKMLNGQMIVEENTTQETPIEEEEVSAEEQARKEGNPFKDQLEENDLKDFQRSTTRKVRNFFSYIPYSVSGETQFVNPTMAYAMLASVFKDIDTTQEDVFSPTGEIAKKVQAMKSSSFEKKVFAYRLENLLNRVRMFENLSYTKKGRFYTDENNDLVFATPIDASKNMRNIDYWTIKKKSNNFNVIKLSEQVTLANMFKNIADRSALEIEDGDNAYEVLAHLYRAHDAADIIRELSGKVNSNFKKNSTRGVFDYFEGHRFFINELRGSNFSVHDNILTNVVDTIAAKNSKWISDKLKKLLATDVEKASKEHVLNTVNDFFKEINLLVSPIVDVNLAREAYKAINIIHLEATKVGTKKPTKEGEKTERYEVEDVINTSKLGGSFRKLSTALNSAYSIAPPLSNVRPDGKISSVFATASYGQEQLQALAEGRIHKKGYASSDIFKFNPLVNPSVASAKTSGLSSSSIYRNLGTDGYIKDHFFHEANIRYQDDTGLMYRDELDRDFIVRSFHYMFLGSFKGIEKASHYAQPTWVPGDRSNITGAITRILDTTGIKFFLKQAVLQEHEISKKSFENVKNFESNKTKSYLYYGDGVTKQVDTTVPVNTTVDEVYKALMTKSKESLENLLDTVFYQKDGFVPNLGEIYKSLETYLKVNPKEFEELMGKWNPKDRKGLNLESREAYKKLLEPVWDLYFMNNYVNSHFLNQAIIGPQQFYKDSYDILKRITVFMAPRQHPVANNKHQALFMPKKRKVLVLKDFKGTISPEVFKAFKRVAGETGFDITDAQGFYSTRFKLQMLQGLGSKAVGDVVKGVQAYIDDQGVPRILKYSSIHLSEDMMNDERFGKNSEDGKVIKNFYAQLQKAMDSVGADEVVFSSTMKVGGPTNPGSLKESKANPGKIEVDFSTITNDAVVEFDNDSFGIQFDPRHDSDSSTLLPSQLNYMINLRGVNTEATRELYGLQSMLIDHTLSKLMNSLDGYPKYRSLKGEGKYRKRIGKAIENTKGMERQAEFFTTRFGEGFAVSLDLPFASKKIIQKWSSIVSKNSVEIRFNGGNFVLQSAIGSDLKYHYDEKTKTGYAEVYLPDIFKKMYESGELKDADLPKLMGFRIPSTDIHSSIVLKVKGFHNSPNNIIQTPPDIVFFHGSDYDVDKLFVIRETTIKDLLPKEVASRKFVKTIVNPVTKEEITIPFLINNVEPDIHLKLKAELDSLNSLTKEQKVIPDVKEYKKLLEMFFEAAVKNKMVKLFISSVMHPETQEFLYSPISFARFNSSASREGAGEIAKSETTVLELLEKYGVKREVRDLSIVVDGMKMRRDVKTGENLTGQVANMFKALGYLFESTEGRTPVTLRDGLEIKLDGGVYETLSLHEKEFVNGEFKNVQVTLRNGHVIEPQIWETIDSILNATIDNVKEQILPRIGVVEKMWDGSQGTMGPLVAAISMGIPLNVAIALINQPGIKSLADLEYHKVFQERLSAVFTGNKNALDTAKEEMAKLYDAGGLNSENLLKNLKFTNPEELQKATPAELAFQLFIQGSIYPKLVEIHKGIGNVAKFLGPLRNLPSNYADISVWYKNAEKVLDTTPDVLVTPEGVTVPTGETRFGKELTPYAGSVFTNVDLTSLPHINSMVKSMNTLKTTIDNLFLVHSDLIKGVVNTTVSNYGLRRAFLTELKENSDSFGDLAELEGLENLRYDFLQMLFAGVSFDYKDIHVNFDTSKEEPYLPKGAKTDSQILTGADAWSQRFIERVRELQKLEAKKPSKSQNQFLTSLSVVSTTKPYYIKSLNLETPKNPDPASINDLYKGFQALSKENGDFSELQFDFLKYLALEGFRFRSGTYAYIMPPKIYGRMSQSIDTFFREIRKDEANKSMSLENLLKVSPFFASQMLVKYGDNLQEVYSKQYRQKKIKNGGIKVKAVLEGGRNVNIYPDLAYWHPGNRALPKVIKDSDGKIYMQVTQYGILMNPKNPDEAISAYRKISNKKHRVTLQWDTSIMQRSKMDEIYSLEKSLTPEYRVVQVRNYTDPIKLADIQRLELKVGDKVILQSYSDPHRLDIRIAELAEGKFIEETKFEKVEGTKKDFRKVAVSGKNLIPVNPKRVFNLPTLEADLALKAKNQFVDLSEPQENVGQEGIINTAMRLSEQFGIQVNIINDPNTNWKGKFVGGKVLINIAHATSDTPFHEFLHPLVDTIKREDPKLYATLVNAIQTTQEGKEALNSITRNMLYNDGTSTLEDMTEEAIVSLVGKMLSGKPVDNRGVFRKLADKILEILNKILGTNFGTFESFKTLADLFNQVQNSDNIKSTREYNQYLGGNYSQVSKDMQDKLQGITDNYKYKLNGDKSLYLDSNNNTYDRLTSWAKNNFSNVPDSQSMAEESAKARFKRAGVDTTTGKMVLDSGEQLSFEDYIAYRKRNFELAAEYGNYIHAAMEFHLDPDPNVKKEAQYKMQDIINKNPEFNEQKFAWIEDVSTVKQAAKLLGLRLPSLDPLSSISPDRAFTEFVIGNEELGIATAVDGLFVHDDGALSINDWKTGRGFFADQGFTTGLLKHWGKQIKYLEDNNLGRAQLEVALRALLIKEKVPDARFRSLKVVHISKKSGANTAVTRPYDVNLESHLNFIEDYMRSEKPEVHAKWKARGLFNVANYAAKASPSALSANPQNDAAEAPGAGATNYDWINYWKAQLATLTSRYPNDKSDNPDNGGRDKQIRESISNITQKIIELETREGTIPPDGSEYDLSFSRRWLGSIHEANNKFVQLWAKVFTTQKVKVQEEMNRVEKEVNELIKAVKEDYDKEHYNPLRSVGASGYNYRNFWDFAWVEKSDNDSKIGWFMRDPNDSSLSENQRKLLIYMRDTMAKKYEEVMNKVVRTELNDNGEVTETRMYQLLGKSSPQLDPDFMPRDFMTLEEARETEGSVIGKIKKTAQVIFDEQRMKYMANYVYFREYKDIHNRSIGQNTIPLRHMGTSEIIESANHTFNAEQAFKKFMNNLITKDHMEETIALADGLRTHLELKKDTKDFSNTIGFLEDQVLLNVLNGKKMTKYATREFTVKINGKEYVTNIDSILQGIKNFTTWSSMWLKPIAGLRNGALILVLNHKEALKGTMGKAVGEQYEGLDFTLKDLQKANGVYAGYLKDAMSGNLENNKLRNIAKNIRYLTDNYDYKVSRDDLVIGKSKWFKESKMYIFHTIGEDYGSYSLLAAQLMHIKNPKTGKSLWEEYDDQGNYVGEGRGKYKNASGELVDLKGLTSEEIIKLKRVSQKIHGGYRQEERSALELYALGRWILQFRKYMPAMMLNMVSGKYKDTTLGYWKEKPGEEGVFEWQEKTMHGKMRILFDLVMDIPNLKQKWKTMDVEERQQVRDSLISVLIFSAWVLGFMAFFDDDEMDEIKKNPYYITFNRLFTEDITQGANPVDWLRNLNTPAPAITKLFNLSEAFYDFMFSGIIEGDRTREGNLPGETILRKSLPIFSSFAEFKRYNTNTLKEKGTDNNRFTRFLFGNVDPTSNAAREARER